jgi:DNA-binding transcriptional LysR family regulator
LSLVPYAADMDELEVREIRYFVAVAEQRNFTRAAERLGIAQPPLSAAIAKLERKLGTRLLERTSRGVTLTPGGYLLLEHGRIAAEAVEAAVRRVRRAGTQPGLTVAVKAGSGVDLIRKITERCAEDPQIPEVHIVFSDARGPAAAVRSGRADVAILRHPFDQRGLDSEVLLTEPRVAVLPAGHRLACQRRLRRADLSGEPMPRWKGQADPAAAAYWTGTDTPAAPGPPGSSPGPPGSSPPTRGTGEGPEISDMNQLLDAVALGHAVAYVPASIARHHRCAELAFVPVSDLSPSQVVAAWPEHSRSRAVAGFIRVAADTGTGRPEQVAAG